MTLIELENSSICETTYVYLLLTYETVGLLGSNIIFKRVTSSALLIPGTDSGLLSSLFNEGAKHANVFDPSKPCASKSEIAI